MKRMQMNAPRPRGLETRLPFPLSSFPLHGSPRREKLPPWVSAEQKKEKRNENEKRKIDIGRKEERREKKRKEKKRKGRRMIERKKKKKKTSVFSCVFTCRT